MIGAWGVVLLWGAVAVGADPLPADWESTKMVLHPAAEPVPALKYRLEPPRRSLEPGNAALSYHRAIVMVLEKRRTAAPGAAEPNPEHQVGDWIGLPLGEIPLDKAVAVLNSYRDVLAEVERGARMDSCDWGLTNRPEGIQLLLPEIQEARTLSRLVTLQTRVALRQGKLDDAWHWIQVGLTLGRHVGEGDVLIQSLVGVAITTVAMRCVEEFIQAPGAPNLYWALANRRRPMVEMRRALEGEMAMLERTLPELATLDDGAWSQDQARRFSAAMSSKMAIASGQEATSAGVGMRLGLATMAAKLYPEAKQALLASGKPAAEVEAMPVIQVSALYAYGQYQKERDDRYKWMGLPYPEAARSQKERSPGATPAEAFGNPLKAMFALLEPALFAAKQAQERTERRWDALQAIEAIRLYMASHDGALPETLDAIQAAPVPLDPAFNRPFEYDRREGEAMLWAPLMPGSPQQVSYAVKFQLVPAGK